MVDMLISNNTSTLPLTGDDLIPDCESGAPEGTAGRNLSATWQLLDDTIRSWWDGDVHTALEEDIRADPEKTLLYLPHPYTTPGGSEKAFPEIYGWDTYYINCALLAHGRHDLVRNNIRNQLFQIDRYGMTLNGNRSWYVTRSQPPLWTEGFRRYFEQSRDHDLFLAAYPLFKKEYEGYWTADHHQTPSGLTTNRDIGDTDAPRLHAESESGLDFFSGFGGEIRECNPLITNCILVNFTGNLRWMAEELRYPVEAAAWKEETERRTKLIRELLWDAEAAFYFDYNFVTEKRIPVWSLNAYWTMWAGIATRAQAVSLVEHLPKFQFAHGLAMTDRDYPSPHPEFGWLQWNYPSGWPPFQVMVAEALQKYGYFSEARQVATSFLETQIALYEQTGHLWEKYNVVDGNLTFPNERYEVPPLHGWSSASVALLGRLRDASSAQA
jgi:alpha,alpha-trehalase